MRTLRRIANVVGHSPIDDSFYAFASFCYARKVHFGPWYPIAQASLFAPESSGVLQTRAEKVMDYKSGISAMVFYACTQPGETLQGFVNGRGNSQIQGAEAAGACFIRYAEAADPTRELNRLLKRFRERFGTPPISNVDPGD